MAEIYEYLGQSVSGTTNTLYFQNTAGTASLTPRFALVRSDGKFSDFGDSHGGDPFTPDQIGTATWSGYIQSGTNVLDDDSTATGIYTLADDFTALSPGYVTIIVYHSATYLSAPQGTIKLYWSGSKFYTPEEWGTIGGIEQEAVSPHRTAIMVPTVGSSLVNEGDPLELAVGDTLVLFAADFRKDLPANHTVASITGVELHTGTTGGITFGSATGAGVQGTQAKYTATGITAGSYVVKVTVAYSNSGGTRVGYISYTVV